MTSIALSNESTVTPWTRIAGAVQSEVGLRVWRSVPSHCMWSTTISCSRTRGHRPATI